MFPKIAKYKKTIYLDNAATTPVDAQVVKAMQPFWSHSYGNPASMYALGREALKAVQDARRTVANLLFVQNQEIFFTAGGTESINLAIFGIAKSHTPLKEKSPHFITSSIEHHAVLHSFDELERMGFATTRLPVNSEGFISLSQLQKAVRPETVFISIMYANNEIGSVQPIMEISRWLKQENQKRIAKKLPVIIFHTDACQAVGSLDINIQRLGVDMLSGNASKMYGPKQIGFLYVRTGVPLTPLVFGGGQERNMRSGTENVPGIVGLACALNLAQKARAREHERLIKLRNYFAAELLKQIPSAELNGPPISVNKKRGMDTRLPGNINISIPDVEGEALMLYLDSYNIAVSTGSACTAQSPDPSHVILALGKSTDAAKSSIRFSLGKTTTRRELEYVLKVIVPLVAALKKG